MLCRERSGGREPNLKELSKFSIYTLSDLGDLSNLIGSLYRTIQQYSPPREWIMCKLAFFPIFLENDLLKGDKILGLTFLDNKILRRIQNGVFPFTVTEFCGRWIIYNSRLIYSRRGRSLVMTNTFESKCLQKFYVSSK